MMMVEKVKEEGSKTHHRKHYNGRLRRTLLRKCEGAVTKSIASTPWYEQLLFIIFFMLSFWNMSTPAQDDPLSKYFSASESSLLLVFHIQHKISRLNTFKPKKVLAYLFQDHPT